MAEKSKLKWLRKEFGSSEELEYYLAQLKHQDKLKSDIISLLQRFQHLLFASYEPDYLTITYNGQWDVTFGPIASELLPVTADSTPATEPSPEQPRQLNDSTTGKTGNKTGRTSKSTTKESPRRVKDIHNTQNVRATPAASSAATQMPVSAPTRTEAPTKSRATTRSTVPTKATQPPVAALQPRPERVDLKTLLQAQLISVGARLKHKTQPSVIATVTREGHLKIGKNEFNSLSGAATSFANSGRRDGWLCWLFQDEDGDWKPIDLLRERWRAEQQNRHSDRHQSA